MSSLEVEPEQQCSIAEIPRDYGSIQASTVFELDVGSFMLARIREELGECGQFLPP